VCNIVTKLASLVVGTLLSASLWLILAALTTVMSVISVMRSHTIENREATVTETLEARSENSLEEEVRKS